MDENPAYEIDFLPVGNGERSGDAIALRYGKLNSTYDTNQKVIVIDGGSLESGKEMVDHINKWYKTNTIDLMVNTHPDADHCSGLREVLEKMNVKELWLHTPWNFVSEYIDLFRNGRITGNGLREALKEGLNIAYEVEQMATKKGIIIKQPFAGLSYNDGIIRVLGPSDSYYSELLAGFKCTPVPEEIISKAFGGIQKVVNYLAESLDIETLDEYGETTAENNSSTIILFSYADRRVLFTGDSGIPAIKNALYYVRERGIQVSPLDVLQIPHHGSRRNISPSILNDLKCECGYISCSKDGAPKHPSKRVTNALNRRNIKAFCTKGSILERYINTTSRPGYGPAEWVQFYAQVEDDNE